MAITVGKCPDCSQEIELGEDRVGMTSADCKRCKKTVIVLGRNNTEPAPSLQD